MKRAISIVFLLTFVLALFAGCEEIQKPKETTVESPVKLWWAYNTENLMQDMEYPELMAQRDQTLRMQCIRGDVESVQLMMTPSVDVSTFDFQMGDLKNTDGDVLKAECFDIYAQWYTEITQSYNTKAYYGFYPDALAVKLNQNGSAVTLQLVFNDTDQFYATEGYRIRVVNTATGETLKIVLWASRFWSAQDKKDSYEITVDGLPHCDEYTVTVEAIDFYGNYSDTKLEATV